MNPQKCFKLKLSRQAILLATFTAAYPVTGYCIAAGRVEFAIGNVESVSANGIRHLLGKGSEINAGDSISTAAGARAQLQFSDGGFISLQPGTLFRVDEYNYQNETDGKERGFFSLLKGGFRAVTGFIGHLHKNSYQVTTAQATLGIRGTGYNMALRDDGLFVNVGEGAVSLSNKAGLLVVSAGNAAYVANFNTAPKLTTQLPLVPPKNLPDPVFTVADQRSSVGNLTILPVVLLSGSGYSMVYAYTATGPTTFGTSGITGVTATFSSSSQLTQYSAGVTAPETGSLGAATVSFSATDGIIGWGRWSGNTAGTGVGPNPLTGAAFDYVVGMPTAVMPTTGVATYSLIGFTTPTDTLGNSGYTLTGTALNVNFAAPTNQIGMTFTVTDNSTRTYAVTGTATIAGSSFAGVGTAPQNGSVCTGGGCTATINGLFAGTNAARAGLAYTINDAIAGNHVQGVAAFTKN